MKRLLRLSAVLTCMAVTSVFYSCDGDKKETAQQAPAADSAAAAAPVNTIVTTPQLMAVIKHKVKDFAAWKAAYDAHDSTRLANGIHNYVIGRGLEDSMEVLVAMKLDDLEKAKAFTQSPDLKARMKAGGVISAPEINFVSVQWQDTASVGSIPRAMTTYSVKDYDTWKKVFEEGRQERLENGLTDRQYGHNADDNHQISIVIALTDTAKARAYWNSDALKQRRVSGGLTSEPKRFVFTIAQRYR